MKVLKIHWIPSSFILPSNDQRRNSSCTFYSSSKSCMGYTHGRLYKQACAHMHTHHSPVGIVQTGVAYVLLHLCCWSRIGDVCLGPLYWNQGSCCQNDSCYRVCIVLGKSNICLWTVWPSMHRLSAKKHPQCPQGSQALHIMLQEKAFIHSFIQETLSSFFVSGTVLGIWDQVRPGKTNNLCPYIVNGKNRQ